MPRARAWNRQPEAVLQRGHRHPSAPLSGRSPPAKSNLAAKGKQRPRPLGNARLPTRESALIRPSFAQSSALKSREHLPHLGRRALTVKGRATLLAPSSQAGNRIAGSFGGGRQVPTCSCAKRDVPAQG